MNKPHLDRAVRSNRRHPIALFLALGLIGSTAAISGCATLLGQSQKGDPTCVNDGSFDAQFNNCTGKANGKDVCTGSCRDEREHCESDCPNGADACRAACTQKEQSCDQQCK